MDWSKLPPLNSLKAFAAVAECGSFAKAGAALNVTHSAVIQQVKALESRLGVKLVERHGRTVKLTPDGDNLARQVGIGFAAIGQGVEALTKTSVQRPVKVSMSPAFATMWLMPRLPGFREQHPEVLLQLIPTSEMVELAPGEADLAIRYHDTRQPMVPNETVMLADMVVVGTPSLGLAEAGTDPAALLDVPWLQELGTDEVADWIARRGIVVDRTIAISHMPGNLIMEAVRRGDGLTYTARPFVEADIASGSLVELFCEPAFGHYYLALRAGVAPAPVKVFTRWLRQQIG